MKAEENGQHPIVAERPRGFNGIAEAGELEEPDVTVAASHIGNRLRPVERDNRYQRSGFGYAESIAAIAVLGGAMAAIVGSARELARRSRHRASSRYPPSDETKPHGDKLLPYGQHHW